MSADEAVVTLIGSVTGSVSAPSDLETVQSTAIN